MDFINTHQDKLSGIFIEQRVNRQSDIDEYMNTGNVNENLESFFKGAEAEGHDMREELKLFDKAKELGIPVICIDSSGVKTEEYVNKSENNCYYFRGESRDEDMANNIKNFYELHPGKYVIIAGAGHVKSGKHFRTGVDTLGARLSNMYPDKYCAILMVSLQGEEYANSVNKNEGFDDFIVST